MGPPGLEPGTFALYSPEKSSHLIPEGDILAIEL